MKQRLLNIELLRIFSMVLICLWHVNGHYLPYLQNDMNHVSILMNYICLFITFHVDLFVLITGYFGIRNGGRTFAKTVILCDFYALVLNIISSICGDRFNWQEVLLPVSSSPWWFLQVYMVLALIAPIIEKFISNSSPKEFYEILGIAVFIDVYLGFFLHIVPYNNHGYDIFNFVLVYLLGCWLRRDDRIIHLLRSNSLLIIVLIIICCFIRYKVQPIDCFKWTDYNSPLNLITALCVFCMFLKTKVSSNLSTPIIFLSSSAVSVYLITDYPRMRNYIAKPFIMAMGTSRNPVMQLVLILVCIICCYIVCCIIDKVRIGMTKPIESKIMSLFCTK